MIYKNYLPWSTYLLSDSEQTNGPPLSPKQASLPPSLSPAHNIPDVILYNGKNNVFLRHSSVDMSGSCTSCKVSAIEIKINARWNEFDFRFQIERTHGIFFLFRIIDPNRWPCTWYRSLVRFAVNTWVLRNRWTRPIFRVSTKLCHWWNHCPRNRDVKIYDPIEAVARGDLENSLVA